MVRAAGGIPPTSMDGLDQWDALNGRAEGPRSSFVYQMTNKNGVATAMRSQAINDYRRVENCERSEDNEEWIGLFDLVVVQNDVIILS